MRVQKRIVDLLRLQANDMGNSSFAIVFFLLNQFFGVTLRV